jgi:hypothetical protein
MDGNPARIGSLNAGPNYQLADCPLSSISTPIAVLLEPRLAALHLIGENFAYPLLDTRGQIINRIRHYNHERPHQGLGNQLVVRPAKDPPEKGRVRCRQRLGGLLKSYYRQAA